MDIIAAFLVGFMDVRTLGTIDIHLYIAILDLDVDYQFLLSDERYQIRIRVLFLELIGDHLVLKQLCLSVFWLSV